LSAAPFAGLSVHDAALARGGRRLFTGLHFDLAPGELLLLHGPNGSGKSSLLRALLGLAPLAEGTLRLGGSPHVLQPRELCLHALYQGHAGAAKAELTAIENLMLAAALDGTLAAGPAGSVACGQALAAVGLERQRAVETRRLSQGQKQRLQLARFELGLAGVVTEPRPLWLMDEPSAALDTDGTALLERLLARHMAGGGAAIVATHLAIAPAGAIARELRIDDFRPRRAAPAGPALATASP
jgi:heme exporter protein A